MTVRNTHSQPVSWAVFSAFTLGLSLTAGSAQAGSPDEPSACARLTLPTPFSASGLRVLLLSPQVPAGKKGDVTAAQLAVAEGMTRALANTLEVQLKRVADQEGKNPAMSATQPVQVRTLGCSVTRPEQARAVGTRLDADLVLWGMVGCGQKDPSQCWAPLQVYALEDPADQGNQPTVASTTGTARAVATSRPPSGWLQYEATAVTGWRNTRTTDATLPNVEPISLDHIALPWLGPDAPGTLVYASMALGLRSQQTRTSMSTPLARSAVSQSWDASADALEKALKLAPADNRPLSPLYLHAGSARLMAWWVAHPDEISVMLPGVLMPDLNTANGHRQPGTVVLPTGKEADSAAATRSIEELDPQARRGLELLEQAYKICDKGDLRCQSTALSQRGWALMLLQFPEKALESFTQAVELNRRARDYGMGAVNANHQGMLLERMRGPAQAVGSFQQARTWSEASGDQGLTADILLNLARCHASLGQMSLALDEAVAAQRLASRIKRSDVLLRALQSVSTLQLRQKNYQAVLDATREAIPLAQTQHEPEKEVYLHAMRAEALLQLGQTAEAKEVLTIALSLAQGLRLPVVEASVLTQLGRLNAAQGDREKAIEFLLQAQPLVENIGDAAWKGANLQLLSEQESALGKGEEALKHARAATDAIRQTSDKDWLLSSLNQLAQLYGKANQPDEALRTYEEAVTLLGNQSVPMAAPVLTEAARLYRQKGDLARAMALYNQALPGIHNQGDAAWEGSVLEQLVQIALALEQPNNALAYAQKALPVIRSTRNPAWEKGMLEQISRLYFAMGQDSDGARYAEQAEAIRP